MANVLVRGSTYLRWVYLLLGAALVLAFILVDSALVSLVQELDLPVVLTGILIAVVVVAPPVVLGGLPAVREVEGIAVESLLGVRFDEQPLGPARTWAQRRRTTTWFCLHLVAGGFVGVISTFVFGVGAVLLAAPFRSPGSHEVVPGIDYQVRGSWTDLWMPLASIIAIALVFVLSAAIGALLAYTAPRVLGPTPAERIELLERRTATLAERNRLARELHDSVGHALSLVTIQAAAARRVLATDPAFAETALAAIETSARAALADLDHVLGLLRDDRRPGSQTAPQATLGNLTRLVEATRAGGITVEVKRTGDLDELPAAVSREAYRIVQEGLTNAIRHAGRPADELTVDLSINLDKTGLLLELTNPVSGTSDHSGGGRGLAGIRERVAVLRGTVEAGLVADRWRLAVTLPVAVTTKG
ncbi:signal transduction histidine kinase [Kribbella orskensis]|uniref:histidine kinase n=1 Tax=Kribbella orskensis TaxID=2512216 RepID=A0ABY2BR33_9ACTN|nr:MULTISPECIES: histidine kinase [Kribbella]TCN43292.1 signal transduction histidine kinase [Kribbella sp. VKM Ac-2500]TCO29352.1 signal transduction histidine kinase [Kribbella orskensis]